MKNIKDYDIKDYCPQCGNMWQVSKDAINKCRPPMYDMDSEFECKFCNLTYKDNIFISYIMKILTTDFPLYFIVWEIVNGSIGEFIINKEDPTAGILKIKVESLPFSSTLEDVKNLLLFM